MLFFFFKNLCVRQIVKKLFKANKVRLFLVYSSLKYSAALSIVVNLQFDQSVVQLFYFFPRKIGKNALELHSDFSEIINFFCRDINALKN